MHLSRDRFETVMSKFLCPSNYDFLLFVRSQAQGHPEKLHAWFTETRHRISNASGADVTLGERELRRVLLEAFKRIQ